MAAGLQSMEHLITQLVKKRFVTIWIISRNVTFWCSYSKESSWISNCSINDFKERNGRFNGNSQNAWGIRITSKIISETIKNETKQHKEGFLPMLLRILAASSLGSTLTGRDVLRACEGTIRVRENF